VFTRSNSIVAAWRCVVRVLVTGGAGFIGSRLVERLAEADIAVTVLDNLSPQIHGSDPDQSSTFDRIKGKAEFVRGDIRDRAAVERALTGVTHVVHLAAETGTGQSMYRIAHYCDVNVHGTGVLLDLLSSKRHDVQRVLVASSRAVYGEGSASCPEHGLVMPGQRSERNLAAGDFEAKCPVCGRDTEPAPTDEDAPMKPVSVYAITKQAQELLVMETCKALGIAAVALRFQNVYGPGQSLVNPYTGILSVFSSALLAGQPLNVFEDGHESRDFVFIDDVVEASFAALTREGLEANVINVGSGRRTSVLDVVHALGAAYGKPFDYAITGDYRVGDIRHNYADTTRMREMLDVQARWHLQDGLARFFAWVLEETRRMPVRPSDYQVSLAEAAEFGVLKRK